MQLPAQLPPQHLALQPAQAAVSSGIAATPSEPSPSKVVKLKAEKSRARYMRFWRTLQEPKKGDGKVPPQLLQCYKTLRGTRGGLTTLLEDLASVRGGLVPIHAAHPSDTDQL